MINVNTQERLNPTKDEIIGNHVWLAHGIIVLKGVIIADNVVVGKNSTIVNNLEQPYSLYVGSPVQKVKDDIT